MYEAVAAQRALHRCLPHPLLHTCHHFHLTRLSLCSISTPSRFETQPRFSHAAPLTLPTAAVFHFSQRCCCRRGRCRGPGSNGADAEGANVNAARERSAARVVLIADAGSGGATAAAVCWAMQLQPFKRTSGPVLRFEHCTISFDAEAKAATANGHRPAIATA